MSDYAVHADVLARHPGYTLGVVRVTGARNGLSSDAMRDWLREAQADLQRRIQGNPAEHPHVRCWREAFRAFGAKPSEHRSAVEALLRRALKPDPMPTINHLVDIGTLVSLRHLLPVGVHPLPPAGEPICLRPSQPGDVFVPMGTDQPECPDGGEIVLAAGSHVLTRRWTWRQSARSQTLVDTTDVFFNVDGLPPVSRDQVLAAMHDVAHLAEVLCGGESRSQILDADSPSFIL